MLHVDANFPGGGVSNVRLEGNALYFQAPVDTGVWNLWFYFRVRGAKGRRLTLVQTGLERTLGLRETGGYGPVVPVWRDGGAWRRVAEETCRYTENPLQFAFEIAPETDECYVAFCFPYQMEDAMRFLRSLPEEWVTLRQIGVTGEGRPHMAALVGDCQSEAVRDLVLVTARQHAGEVSGSYVMEGFLKALTDGSARMRAILEKTLFLVIPILDVDCVEEGRYGKDQYPVDFGYDYTQAPLHVEIRNEIEAVRSLSQRYRLRWALDLHAPQPGAASYLPPDRAFPAGSPQWNQMWNTALRFESLCREKLCYNLADVDVDVMNWGGVNSDATQESYFAARWNCPYTGFEFAYHRDGEGKLIGVSEWETMGGRLALTMAELLENFDGMKRAPNLDLIPAWTLPPKTNRWKSLRKLVGLQIAEDAESLCLAPDSKTNSAFLRSQTRPYPGEGKRALRFEADAACVLEAYCVFYQNGLRVKNLRSETLALSEGESFEYALPPAPETGLEYAISVIVQDLKDKLTLRDIVGGLD